MIYYMQDFQAFAKSKGSLDLTQEASLNFA